MAQQEGNEKKYDLAVVIGRFQPLHAGHMSLLRAGLANARHLLVLVGSANEPRSFENPFTAGERCALITQSLAGDAQRVHPVPIESSNYQVEDWLARAVDAVAGIWAQIRKQDPAAPSVPTIALVGHDKDASTYYLDLFPQWDFIDVPPTVDISATQIRQHLFGVPPGQLKEGPPDRLARDRVCEFLLTQSSASQPLLPAPVIQWLEDFMATPAYLDLVEEYAYVARYRQAWSAAPYAPIFVTADAVVVHEDHVLLIQRAGFPGRGLWALPGGFVEADEPIRTSMFRELTEEVGLELSSTMKRECLAGSRVFDEPRRSSRGRTITHAFLLRLPPGPRPTLTANPEETRAMAWRPIAELQRSEMFEDHYKIIHAMLRQFSA